MKNKILMVLSVLFGLMFINAGLNKFFNYMPVPEDLPERLMEVMGALMEIGWLLPLVGVIEILGGLLFLIPKFRALGAVMLFPIMIGILLTHILDAPSGLPMALVLFAILLWVLYENRAKYAGLIS